jgi:hypothetical protein
VEAAVVELDLDTRDRKAGQRSGLQRFADALLDRLDEFARNRAADDLVVEDEVGPVVGRILILA